ncbi:MAG: asparagine synthase (glutamine-hydrolyzing) [Dinghuibacter sp.]|nr:asparagine synthase (glutamine-hydrolyzing) [Dinghuibacter sp.]
MCGIAGMVSGVLPNQAVQANMLNRLAHRGPDGEAHWQNTRNTVWLGHRRLKIIDLSAAAAQPMHRQNRYTIVHNGEIYNYLEVKAELEKKGQVFQTVSDTEVILAAYAVYGKNCVQHFEGMFAFAIWDEEEQHLFAARDRFGEKPFYYCLHNGAFIFASEIKALWAAGVPQQPDPAMMLLYLGPGLSNIPGSPERTFYSNIYELPPAHQLTITVGSTQPGIMPYWQLDKNNYRDFSANTAIEQFRSLFFESVKKRMRSDVPAGTCLSGGLDSASVAAACNQLAGTQYRHTCFTASFPGFEKDETALSTITAQQFHLKQVLVTPTAEEFITDLEKMLYHQEQPVNTTSAYAQYRVFKAARETGIIVLLDGQGADETLAGYTRYLHWFLQELLIRKPLAFYKEKKALQQNGWPLQWGFNNYAAALLPGKTAQKLEQRAAHEITGNPMLNPEYVQAFFHREMIQKPRVRTLNDILHFTTTQQGLHDLLRMADRNSMAHGVEVRLPFLCHRLVEFVFSLPATMKIHEGFTKWVLRRAMNGLLPNAITGSTVKTGFETPEQQWLQHRQAKEMVHAAVQQLQQQGILAKNVQANVAGTENGWRYICAARFVG